MIFSFIYIVYIYRVNPYMIVIEFMLVFLNHLL